MYEKLSPYEKALANFADKIAIVAGLEISNKISPEDAHQQVKSLYQELKALRKLEKVNWDNMPN